jgi:hypothetical protein
VDDGRNIPLCRSVQVQVLGWHVQQFINKAGKMRIKFKGIVTTGDDSRVSGEANNGAILIGGIDVVSEMYNHRGECFTFGIADKRFEGSIFVELGYGYSEYTPMESDTLKVGNHDLIEILRRYEGQEITLFAFNEPANILDDSEWREVKSKKENSKINTERG